MSDKPKRWTWEECSQKYKAGTMVTPSLVEDAFRTNDKYIDWQEKRINELDKRIDRMRDECISILERDVAPLDIKCMEQEKTIIKLKEALEFYAYGKETSLGDCPASTALKECFPEKHYE